MSLQRFAICVALLSKALLDCKTSPFFTVDEELSIVRDLENRILDLVESPIRYYLRSDVDNNNVDLNLMLGVSIMKGKGYLFCFRLMDNVLTYCTTFSRSVSDYTIIVNLLLFT